ncbi:hypothetical protein CW663_11545, partial [Macrococcoides caseolyticum]
MVHQVSDQARGQREQAAAKGRREEEDLAQRAQHGRVRRRVGVGGRVGRIAGHGRAAEQRLDQQAAVVGQQLGRGGGARREDGRGAGRAPARRRRRRRRAAARRLLHPAPHLALQPRGQRRKAVQRAEEHARGRAEVHK